MPLRVVFMGTPDFSVPTLRALAEAGHEVAAVYTQPPRAGGRRGLEPTPSSVQREAQRLGIPVRTPPSLKDEAGQAAFRALAADVAVVVAYGLILPKPVLEAPRLGCLNGHASLLPRWRGAAPIQRAIEAGDAQTGVTIMQMDQGLDTGDMLLERIVPIGADTNAAMLHDALAQVGGEAIVEALDALAKGGLTPRKQPEAGVTYAAKLDKAESALDCTQPAELLARRVRAFNPVPGASIRLPGLPDPVKVWRAQALDGASAAEPGSVLRADGTGIDIATGQGVLRLLELQKAGGKRQPVDVFVRGWQPA